MCEESGPYYAVRSDLKTIVGINGEFYRLLYKDEGFMYPEDHGLYRAWKVKRDQFNRWFVCDDDDYMIDPDIFKIVAKEYDWCLRRENLP